jgi:cbb3-type cytochrome oxidase maturation protein
MEIIFILLGISLIVGVLFLLGFLFSVKSGQYDDMYTPSVRILFENEKPLKVAEPEVEEKEKSKKFSVIISKK